MEIVRPDAVPAGAKPGAGEAVESAREGGRGESFDQVMSQVEGKAQVASPAAPTPGVTPPQDARVAEIAQEKARVAETPGGVERLGREIETHSVRLRELIDELQSGRTFTTQELIGMQAEMHEITLQIEVTTRTVAETVSGVRQLAQQQG
jgi:hypothetical protein